VLVIGGSITGVGMEDLVNEKEIELVETDVSFGPRTMLICDAHDIPFKGETFDGAIAQAVLEHVADPYRCVEEIFRVLRPNGTIYAETPFMQQVHGKCFDFTRFTDRGHRRLFRRFKEVRSGICGGPGTALAWSCQYFLLSFTANKVARAFVRIGVKLSLFWLKYFDYILQNKPGAVDAASGFFFLGQKSESIITDREVCEQYRGANSVDL
jgi:SAM-dependent methyltransferase